MEKDLGDFIRPIPKVKVSPDTYRWKCPRCKKRNDDGDTTCTSCGQDVEHGGAFT